MAENNAEGTSLTLAFSSDVTNPKQNLERVQRVAFPRLIKSSFNVFFCARTHSANSRIKVQQLIPSGRTSHCTIFSELHGTIELSFVLDSINKTIHILLLSLEEILKTLYNVNFS